MAVWEKTFLGMQTNFCPKIMNIQTLTEESRSHKLEFINLYCKHVAKFTKMFALNRYKAHKFEMIMD